MKLISVNVGLPREIDVGGKTVRTSIWKDPVQGRVRVSTLNLDGDQQSDLAVHGGVDKAVYLYPSEHYSYWRTELPDVELPWGAFGENFTAEGILDDQIRVGDRLRVGSAEFIVTQPRMPCFKLGIRFNRRDIIKRFLQSKRTGFYLAVLREGEVEQGDAIEWSRAGMRRHRRAGPRGRERGQRLSQFVERPETGVTITDIVTSTPPIRKTRSYSIAPPSYRRCRKAGKIIFGSVRLIADKCGGRGESSRSRPGPTLPAAARA